MLLLQLRIAIAVMIDCGVIQNLYIVDSIVIMCACNNLEHVLT